MKKKESANKSRNLNTFQKIREKSKRIKFFIKNKMNNF